MFRIPDDNEMDLFETIEADTLQNLMVFRQARPAARQVLDLNTSASILGTSIDEGTHELSAILHQSCMWAEHEKSNMCTCKGQCKRGCPCLNDMVKCTNNCKCFKGRCNNRLQKAAINSDAYGEAESRESSSSEESSIGEEDGGINSPIEDSSEQICCSCKGSCKRSCPCKNVNKSCNTQLCSCSAKKCSRRSTTNTEFTSQDVQQRKRRIRPADLRDEQAKRADAAYNEAKVACEQFQKGALVKRLCLMAKFSPSLWQKVHEMADDPMEPVQAENKPDWCICGHCRKMPDNRQHVCCMNHQYNHEHPFFETHILLEATLELAMRNNADHLQYPFDPSNPACWRFTAYRQFCLWAWGRLGRHNRKVIPSCCVWKIRDRFPDPVGNYTGFFDVEFNL